MATTPEPIDPTTLRAPAISDLTGDWTMVSHAGASEATVEPETTIDPAEDQEGWAEQLRAGTQSWLTDPPTRFLSELAPVEGTVTLTVSDDGTVSEDGQAIDPRTGRGVENLDEEGIVSNSENFFAGHLAELAPGRVFAIDEDHTAVDGFDRMTPDCDATDEWFLRESDGRTQLVRTVSVVNDEMYLERLVYVYERA